MTTAEPPTLSVCAPAYNERDSIEPVLRDWVKILSGFGRSAEIVVTNDGSTDGTGDILTKLAAEIPELRVVNLTKNGGYGRALAAAITASRGKFVITIDSDGQFDLADAKKMLERAERENCDLVTGYRVAKKDSILRVFANHAQNSLVNILCGVKLRDSNCALKVMRGELIRSMKLESTGYPFPTEISVRIGARGHKVVEEPVAHRERTAGQSKLKFLRTVIRMLVFLFYLRKRIRLYKAGHLQDI